jgi:hypothetical protein
VATRVKIRAKIDETRFGEACPSLREVDAEVDFFVVVGRAVEGREVVDGIGARIIDALDAAVVGLARDRIDAELVVSDELEALLGVAPIVEERAIALIDGQALVAVAADPQIFVAEGRRLVFGDIELDVERQIVEGSVVERIATHLGQREIVVGAFFDAHAVVAFGAELGKREIERLSAEIGVRHPGGGDHAHKIATPTRHRRDDQAFFRAPTFA